MRGADRELTDVSSEMILLGPGSSMVVCDLVGCVFDENASYR